MDKEYEVNVNGKPKGIFSSPSEIAYYIESEEFLNWDFNFKFNDVTVRNRERFLELAENYGGSFHHLGGDDCMTGDFITITIIRN